MSKAQAGTALLPFDEFRRELADGAVPDIRRISFENLVEGLARLQAARAIPGYEPRDWPVWN